MKQTPQEGATGAAIVQHVINEQQLHHARRVTGEYMGEITMVTPIRPLPDKCEPIEQIKGIGYFKDWHPDTDYNQLMMVVEKLRKEEGGYGLLIEAEGKGGVSCSLLMGTNNSDAHHEDLGTAILLCITKALEARK